MSTQTLAKHPRDVRELIRSGQWRGVTSGVAPGYVQANLAILPRELAFDFLLFCQRNPKPCPLLEVIESGRVEPALTAPGADSGAGLRFNISIDEFPEPRPTIVAGAAPSRLCAPEKSELHVVSLLILNVDP